MNLYEYETYMKQVYTEQLMACFYAAQSKLDALDTERAKLQRELDEYKEKIIALTATVHLPKGVANGSLRQRV